MKRAHKHIPVTPTHTRETKGTERSTPILLPPINSPQNHLPTQTSNMHPRFYARSTKNPIYVHTHMQVRVPNFCLRTSRVPYSTVMSTQGNGKLPLQKSFILFYSRGEFLSKIFNVLENVLEKVRLFDTRISRTCLYTPQTPVCPAKGGNQDREERSGR